MKPIRSNELNYLDTLIHDKFRNRRQNIESEIEAATQKQTDKNYSKFVERLGLKAQIKAYKEADMKLKKFQEQKESYESKLFAAQTNKKIELEQKLQSWASIRGWQGNYNDTMEISIKDYDDVSTILSKACNRDSGQKRHKFHHTHIEHAPPERSRSDRWAPRKIEEG